MRHRTLPPTVPLVTALLLSGCQHTPAAQDPYRPYLTQNINWQPCDPTVLGTDPQVYAARFAALGERLQCADIQVPRNWDTPDEAITVSILRVRAADPAQRQGALWFNPGGPGADGLNMAVNFAYVWNSYAPDGSDYEQQFHRVQAEYDFIGFSPRGTGNSTRLYCGLKERLSVYFAADLDRSDANVEKMFRNGRLEAKACAKNPLTPDINTEFTVRDMNLMRQLLGEERLNYLGYSYGTWLGAWYARTFPKHTGRLVFDSNMNWTGRMKDNWRSIPQSFHRSFKEVVAPYLARHPEYSLGQTADAVYHGTLNLSEPLRSAVRTQLYWQMYNTSNYPLIGLTLRIAQDLDAALQHNPQASDSELYSTPLPELPNAAL